MGVVHALKRRWVTNKDEYVSVFYSSRTGKGEGAQGETHQFCSSAARVFTDGLSTLLLEAMSDTAIPSLSM